MPYTLFPGRLAEASTALETKPGGKVLPVGWPKVTLQVSSSTHEECG